MDALMPTYARLDLAFERGEGPYLFTTDGTRYLDFGTGIAVTALGHAHPKLVAVLAEQAGRLWHTSNLYRIGPQERLATRLVEHSFADRVFFCNSGAEASEGVIKTVRRFHYHRGNSERAEVIVTDGAFHGRTLAGLAAGGNEAHRAGFTPLAAGFVRVPYGDLEATRAAVTDRTAAVFVEPLQGESGIVTAPQGYLAGLRSLCDEHGILLALDEVQTGVGRTGRFLACEWEEVAPDVAGLAKGLGSGFPIGAVLATERAAVGMVPGTHGSTFGGNFLASAVADAVVEEILAPGFLAGVEQAGVRLRDGLEQLRNQHPGVISEVRGRGLMLGMTAAVPAADLYSRFREHRLLTVPAGGDTVRMLPPLNIENAHVDEALTITEAVFRTFR
ncbi:MAG: aspartate aminotransferase family protein [Rhodospirillales bacterium]|nr:aspartate aminotransferase family protein [Rhodospirillales bacterium]